MISDALVESNLNGFMTTHDVLNVVVASYIESTTNQSTFSGALGDNLESLAVALDSNEHFPINPDFLWTTAEVPLLYQRLEELEKSINQKFAPANLDGSNNSCEFELFKDGVGFLYMEGL